MEVLFHFFFEIFKIAILSCVYATVLLLVFSLLGYFATGSWFARVSKGRFRLWFGSTLCILMALSVFMFTYWGDQGLAIAW